MRKYIYKPYSKLFGQIFNKEKDRLRNFLGNNTLIEHVGSTSIPGMGGKGIIDIVVAVTYKKDLPNISSKLIEAGYYYEPEDGTIERWFHGRKVSDSERYHIHLTFKGGRDWREMISFRDYIKTHPEDFERYVEIKRKAVEEADQDRDIYMKVKEPFIKEIIEKAK